MPKYKKGESGNIKGRPKGSKSEKVKAWDELGEYIVGEGAERYMALLTDLGNDEFLKRFENILEYFKPKQQRTDITSGGEALKPPQINFVDENSQKV